MAALLLEQLGFFGVFGSMSTSAAIVACSMVGVLLGLVNAGGVLVGIDLCLLALYMAISVTPLVVGPVARWVRADPLSGRPIDAVVVLSSGISSDSSIDVVGLDRLLTGIELSESTLTHRIVTTRVHRAFGKRIVSSDSEQSRLIRLAGAAGGWLVVDSVNSTRDEATRTAQLLLGFGTRKIALVTSPMHTRRACATFEAVGFEVLCVPAREHQWSTHHPASGSDRLAAFRDYLYERLATVKYRMKGWIS